MKRRKFLQMLGAATAAPVLPIPAVGAAATPAAPVSAAAIHGAILHAQSSPYLSSWGLSKALKINAAQSDALMTELARRGVISPVSGARASSRWAASRVHNPIFAKPRRRRAQKTSETSQQDVNHKRATHADAVDPLMSHLIDLCRTRGMALGPCCDARVIASGIPA